MSRGGVGGQHEIPDFVLRRNMIGVGPSNYKTGCKQCGRAIRVAVVQCPECGSTEVTSI